MEQLRARAYREMCTKARTQQSDIGGVVVVRESDTAWQACPIVFCEGKWLLLLI